MTDPIVCATDWHSCCHFTTGIREKSLIVSFPHELFESLVFILLNLLYCKGFSSDAFNTISQNQTVVFSTRNALIAKLDALKFLMGFFFILRENKARLHLCSYGGGGVGGGGGAGFLLQSV